MSTVSFYDKINYITYSKELHMFKKILALHTGGTISMAADDPEQ